MVTLGPKHPSMGDMLDRILEGVTIEADFRVPLGDDDLLGMKNRLILSSFNTAAELGLGFQRNGFWRTWMAGPCDKPTVSCLRYEIQTRRSGQIWSLLVRAELCNKRGVSVDSES